MISFHLVPSELRRLLRHLRSTQDARELRRIIALLEVHRGQSIHVAASHVGVTSRSVYSWIEEARSHVEFSAHRVQPDAGGRPPVWNEEIEEWIRALLSHEPDHLGYRARSWSIPLLKHHLSRWAGEEMSEHTIRRHLHEMGFAWKRPRYVLSPDPDRARKMRDIRKKVAHLDERSVLLFQDETDLLLFPPLRSAWAERGMAAQVPISGWNEKRVVFAAINVCTGHLLSLARPKNRAQDFQFFLRHLQWHYRGWHIVIVLDSGPSHTARSTEIVARALGIDLIFLPYRAPELNPIETLWGKAKDIVCANRQYEGIEDQADQFIAYLLDLSLNEALQKTGLLHPERFWLWKN